MAVYGFGKKGIRSANWAPVARKGYYVPGQGTFERQPSVYLNDAGEKVVQSAGVLRHTDGSLHQAYAAQPGSYIEELLAKWRRGEPLTEAERMAIQEYLATNPTAGLPSVNDLGGNHNGGITTKVGTEAKDTSGTSIISGMEKSKAQRRESPAATISLGGPDTRPRCPRCGTRLDNPKHCYNCGWDA